MLYIIELIEKKDILTYQNRYRFFRIRSLFLAAAKGSIHFQGSICLRMDICILFESLHHYIQETNYITGLASIILYVH